MASMAEALPPIALIDVREGGPVRHAREHARGAQALRDDCLAWFPAVAGPFVPLMDRLARRWLRRSRSPYLAEIEAIAATLGFPGVWLLNGSYEWGCTALAREEAELPWLARTLDWPFHGLGRHAEVARMRGPAGDFFSVTWPGYVGVLTAMAPQRFAAAINQAPKMPVTGVEAFDEVVTRLKVLRSRGAVPGTHLLRQVFERAPDYNSALEMLADESF